MLRVEIADSPSKQAQGLMFRKSLSDNDGMIFVFKNAEKLRFWGVNTYIPLDIAFVDPHHRVTQISTIYPLSQKTVESETKCCIAIEANVGFFEKNHIHIGDKIDFKKLSDRTGIVDFNNKTKTAQFIGTRENGSDGVQQSQEPVEEYEPIDNDEQYNGPEYESLPVVNLKDLSSLLEDSYDDDEETSPEGQQPLPEQPEITKQPEMVPQEEKMPEDFEMPDKEYPEFGNPQQALRWAEDNDEVIRIWYTTKSGRDIEREVEPHGQFVAHSTGNPLVVTFDETIGDIRAFIVPKIMFHSFVGKKFAPKFVIRR